VGALGGIAVVAQEVGCSSAGSSSREPSVGSPIPPAEGTGTVGMKLTLPGGEVLSTVSWSITGPGGATTVVKSGSFSVQNAASLSFVVGNIPAATGYAVSISGTSTDGKVTCLGSASFNVAARTTTSVTVLLQCDTAAANVGTAQITGQTFVCATVNSLTASPTETIVGPTNPVAVSATATGPNAGAVTYQWSAPSGSFSAPTSAQSTFTCSVPGTVTLSVTASDGSIPDGGSCNPALSTATVQVQCEGHLDAAQALPTATRIKHLVVIFGENISFDHYFGTYPTAQNNAGETPFTAAPGTPTPNNLVTPLDPTKGFAPGVSFYATAPNLLTANPVATNTANGSGAVNPFRLGPSQAATQDMGHNYKPEQQASDTGLMDLFPKYTGTAGPPPGSPAQALTTGLVMAYYDGNTANAMWNYAQSYALNDNAWTTNFGPSTPGAINLISGQTNGFLATNRSPTLMSTSHVVADGQGGYTLIGDTDPLGDMCSTAADQNSFSGQNIGNLLNARNVSWGWFAGGFNLSIVNPNGTTGCARSSVQAVSGIAAGDSPEADYIPHHMPFQYYPSTANPTHARPSALSAIGNSLEADGVTPEPANHQYDSQDFFAALSAGNLPAVVYLKAPSIQDAHPGYSDPIDEQNFVTSVVTALQGAQEWSSTAIVITYDDSDGWYDHQAPPIVNPSNTTATAFMPDQLNGPGLCNSGAQQAGAAPTTPLLGVLGMPVQGRCGYGTRIPLLVLSPYAKPNYIDHTLLDQSSVLRFVEDNWLAGQRVQPGGSFDTIANSIQNMMSGI
jgi:phospholipase C